VGNEGVEVGGGIVKVIPLIENSKVENFHSEKGLSLYIESKDKKILFDTGKSGNLIKNLKKMEIDIFDIDYFIISHGHKDHMGGLGHLLELGIDPDRVVIKKGALDLFYFKSFLKKRIGLTEGELKKLKGLKAIEMDNIYKIEENIYLIAPGGRRSPFYYKNAEKDDFSHEVSLVVIEDEKLNVVVGCCHFGVKNLIDLLNLQFNHLKINSMTGGLHTRSMPLNPLAFFKFISLIKGSKIKSLNLGHCTGTLTIFLLKKFIKNINRLFIGREYHI